jgi:hypothetical protein
MNRRFKIVPMLVLLAVYAGPAAAITPALKKATRIIRYSPATPGIGTKQGHCWTGSIAIPRPDAWRCMVGNEIFDPCFSSEDGMEVVCDVDPSKGNPGFNLQLTEPLPTSENPPQETGTTAQTGWLIELDDGTYCRPATGATGIVDGKAATYYCASESADTDVVLLGDLDSTGPVWTAEKAVLVPGPKGPRLAKSKRVGIKTVWQ